MILIGVLVKGIARIAFLFVLALGIGLTLVHLRTLHIQSVYEITQLTEEQQKLQQDIWMQQAQLSLKIQRPAHVKAKVETYDLDILPPGQLPQEFQVWEVVKNETN